MPELLTAARMREIEHSAIASGTVTGLELMERAGCGVVEAVFAEWPGLKATSHRATVLCGPGNNGGDGFVIARLLKEWGWEVRVLAVEPAGPLPPDADENARRWRGMGAVEPLTEAVLRSGPPSDLYVDAVFGTGLSRPPEGEILKVLTHIGGRNGDRAHYRPRLVAVDAPSGLCLDSGRMLIPGGAGPAARLTVTFDSLKVGHVLAEGPEHCGRVVVKDIGIAPWRRMQGPRRNRGPWTGTSRPVRLGLVDRVADGDVEARLHPGAVVPGSLGKAGWAEAHATHKYRFGHALILSGGSGRGGAARLAARGALRIGAGLVTVGCPPEALTENAARLDAVMLRSVADAEALVHLLEDGRITALCLGPGMGTGAREAGLVAAALAGGPGGPHAGQGPGADPGRGGVVLDADALTLLAAEADLFAGLHAACVLTPHGGEFARLFPDIAERLAAPATRGPAFSRVDATQEAAARAGCVVLSKGPDTVIADPSGRCAVHAAAYGRAAPWLASAGSGDVLAGFIAGLLARGFAPFDAACSAAWLHVEAARAFGPGLIAEDLPEAMPRVFRDLGL